MVVGLVTRIIGKKAMGAVNFLVAILAISYILVLYYAKVFVEAKH